MGHSENKLDWADAQAELKFLLSGHFDGFVMQLVIPQVLEVLFGLNNIRFTVVFIAITS